MFDNVQHDGDMGWWAGMGRIDSGGPVVVGRLGKGVEGQRERVRVHICPSETLWMVTYCKGAAGSTAVHTVVWHLIWKRSVMQTDLHEKKSNSGLV
jgi:hypothetical protein